MQRINTDFFARQDKARKFTSFAVFIYALCLMALGFAVFCVVRIAADGMPGAIQRVRVERVEGALAIGKVINSWRDD